MKYTIGYSFTLLLALATATSTADSPGIRHVVLVTMDGVRVEEMFGGMDVDILASQQKPYERLADSPAYRHYKAPTREARRQKLMPFFWRTLMRRHGFIVGDPQSPAKERLLNQHRLSYPGYSEIFTGQAHDDVLTSNGAGQNPYPSVLELIRAKLGLSRPEVAVFASWRTMRQVVEHVPGSVFVNAGRDPYAGDDPEIAAINRLQMDVPTESDATRPDACTFELALAHLHRYHPRFLYVGFDETDALAHADRYADVLDAMARTDRWLQRLWNDIERDPELRGRTALIVTVDHGRGHGTAHWSEHGAGVAGADDVWTAFVVPGNHHRGVLREERRFVHAQLAATLARLLGVEYSLANPAAAPPIATAFM